jgi:hypothetical protein
VISGVLGLAAFTASGLLWDAHPFLGQLFMELGGGAFIVFLLEVVLPSALGYADSMRRVLRVTTLVWSQSAVTSLVTHYDDDEGTWLADEVRKARFPAHATLLGRVRSTGEDEQGHPVLARTLPVGPTTVRYYVRDRGSRRRTVVIAALQRHHAAG